MMPTTTVEKENKGGLLFLWEKNICFPGLLVKKCQGITLSTITTDAESEATHFYSCWDWI